MNPTPSRPGLVVRPSIPGRIAWLSDQHYPYQDQPAIDAALDFLETWRPDLLILGGDLFDCYSISRYEKDPRRLHETLQREFDAAQGFARAVGRLGCEVVYLLGNHECRLDAIVAAHPGLGGLLSLGWPQIASLPDSWTVCPNQSRYRIGGLDFLHGDLKGRGSGGRHVASKILGILKRSCVFGHYHRPQVFPEPDGDGVLRAGFSTGHLCDPVRAADYCPVNDWWTGFLTVDMDPATGLSDVRSHWVHDGKFRFQGVTYGG
jgi:predicted phosphodiesterase